LRKAITAASEDLFPQDSTWSETAVASLMQGNSDFGDRIQSFLKDESGSLDRYRALQKTARENLYRLLATIEGQMKNFKDRALNEAPLEQLRKQIDRLLVAISTPS